MTKCRICELIIGVPFILLLMFADAMCCAWDEWRSDWRSLKHWIRGDE